MNKQVLVSAGLIVASLAVVGFQLRSGDGGAEAPEMDGHDHAAMTAGAGGERQPVRLSSDDARRIGVSLSTVERRVLPVSVRTVGTVAYDETRLAAVNPKITGWVERLYVDFTGAPVEAGQPLMDVYSPALVSAQEELVLAAGLARDAASGRAFDNARELLESARRRLSYWDIPDEVIRAIEESGEPRKTLTLRAPASGVVVEKNVVEGDRIMPGMTVYRIADLSTVWLEADVFEKDLGLVREGQTARIAFEAFPGETFTGRVTYVYPTVSMQSRTGRIRLELANPGRNLRPGMYAEIGLDVPTGEPSLVVPRSAVLATGRRSLVFVEAADGALRPRDVVTGRTSGTLVEVLEGLREGERVVSAAAFLVDAESSLGTMTGEDMGGPSGDSMPDGEMDHSDHDMGGPADDSMPDGGTDHSDHDMGGPAGGSMPDTVDHTNHR